MTFPDLPSGNFFRNYARRHMASWWAPLFLPMGTGLLFTLMLALQYTPLWHIGKYLDGPFLLLFLLSFAANFTCGILHLCRKQIKRGIAVLISNLIYLFVCLTGMTFLILTFNMTAPDHFADYLKLPDNIALTEPLSCPGLPPENNKPPLPDARNGQPGMVLYNDFQGGLYILNVLCNPGEDGALQLKGREITTGAALKLSPRTKTIRGSSNAEEIFPCQLAFTLYNRNWGQYYGAGLELWFTPASGKPPRKLFSGNYKVQGWQR